VREFVAEGLAVGGGLEVSRRIAPLAQTPDDTTDQLLQRADYLLYKAKETGRNRIMTETVAADGRPMHGLNGDILVWNPVTRRRHELSSMGIRVTKETLVEQLKATKQEHFLTRPYHQAIMNDRIPLSIGGGIGQSRTYQYLLRGAALGEFSVTVWPKVLRDICAKRNIHLLE